MSPVFYTKLYQINRASILKHITLASQHSKWFCAWEIYVNRIITLSVNRLSGLVCIIKLILNIQYSMRFWRVLDLNLQYFLLPSFVSIITFSYKKHTLFKLRYVYTTCKIPWYKTLSNEKIKLIFCPDTIFLKMYVYSFSPHQKCIIIWKYDCKNGSLQW